MPVERRIREGAERNAGVLDPDVDRVLNDVVRRTRRRTVARRSLAAVVAVPVIVLALVVGPHLLDALPRSTTPASQPPTGQTQGPVAPQLSGTFTRTLSGSLAVARANGIAGTWTISTYAQGRLQLLAPPSFSGPPGFVLFEVSPNRLRTRAFAGDICAGVSGGTYTWARNGGVLQFTVVRDRCDARVAIIAAGPWRSGS